MATLFIVATPIGNLEDVSERAKRTLAGVSMIACEDTRVTGKLLSKWGIKTPTMSYHQHSGDAATAKILQQLEEGSDVALVTDAGTPGISDPGGKLVALASQHVTVTPVPGPSALTAALSIAGVPIDEFLFLGFPPNKKGRQTFFDRLAAVESTAVLYESTHRILKTLKEIGARQPQRHLVVCRELTKRYETIYRGTASQITKAIESSSAKGEFVVVLAPFRT